MWKIICLGKEEKYVPIRKKSPMSGKDEFMKPSLPSQGKVMRLPIRPGQTVPRVNPGTSAKLPIEPLEMTYGQNVFFYNN